MTAIPLTSQFTDDTALLAAVILSGYTPPERLALRILWSAGDLIRGPGVHSQFRVGTFEVPASIIYALCNRGDALLVTPRPRTVAARLTTLGQWRARAVALAHVAEATP